ncbi:hypothetical protein C8R44DRAFT_803145 [Mycena epipterygia]|nr:hypothetical protein C8R44DRAFT_803145 [Mycena epipterygia]
MQGPIEAGTRVSQNSLDKLAQFLSSRSVRQEYERDNLTLSLLDRMARRSNDTRRLDFKSFAE